MSLPSSLNRWVLGAATVRSWGSGCGCHFGVACCWYFGAVGVAASTERLVGPLFRPSCDEQDGHAPQP